ncbi:heavy metal-binding protein HIP-like [Mytilus californianus]|uniref:heavy metal-binding protein HIP-like n=1 Tax=Mytilus californianus TaxID=6549 RepID=UPI002247925A|nr:heavy metal-binding protein HIP-like [Mytilus californianus]
MFLLVLYCVLSLSSVVYNVNVERDSSENGFLWIIAKQLDRLENKFQEIQKQYNSRGAEIESIKETLQRQSPSVVTFLARLISPSYGSIAAKATVKFERITENIGSGYNSGTGIFTAPTKGLYHFTASARQSRSGYLHLGLFRNEEEMAVSVGVNYNSLTIGATFTLQSGDRVYVKNIWSRSSGIVGAGQSYFSGNLVHKM